MYEDRSSQGREDGREKNLQIENITSFVNNARQVSPLSVK